MRGLRVLSPHRDDAVFSLFLALSRWSKLKVPITVLNFFTISSYAPHVSASLIPEISAAREREDRRALAFVDRRVRIEALGLLDAPIRLNISAASISSPENTLLLPPGEIESLAARMRPYFMPPNLALAPLALGNHIDHRSVHSAALKAHTGQRLGFYEDLPYASWTSEEELAARVNEIELATGTALKPAIIRSRETRARKFCAVSAYRSQITRTDAKLISDYTSRYSGGERIWIPKHGSFWRALTQ